MSSIKEQLQDYMDLLNLVYKWKEKDGVFELEFSERKDEKPATEASHADTFQYIITVRPGKQWVRVYCDIYPLDELPKEKQDAVLLDLLRCNRDYAEVCFDYDKNRKMIGSSQEMMVQGLSFDLFRGEFLAVPWAVKKFWSEVAKKHGLK
jgi:hypothetical protein